MLTSNATHGIEKAEAKLPCISVQQGDDPGAEGACMSTYE